MFFRMAPGPAGFATASIRCRWVLTPSTRGQRNKLRGFYDLACLDAAGAHANPLVAAAHLGLDGPKVDVPTAFGNVVRVRDLVTELRAFAADCANLSHDKLQIT